MKISAIIPHLSNQATLRRTVDSLNVAAEGLDVEIILVEDQDCRGAAWARNRGLERAKGDVVFFVDADDTVDKGYFREPVAEIERTGADLCFFEFHGGSLHRDYNLEGNETIRSVLLSAFLGYSFDSVRHWNKGGSLWHGRDLGYIWRVAFRREFLSANSIRFDEAMRISDDAAFLCECALYAKKTVSLRRPLYEYRFNPNGITATAARSRVRWNEKFASKAMRERIDALSGGIAWKYCEASCVFALLEMSRTWKRAGLSVREAVRGIREYKSDPRVRNALKEFPLSWRHPVVALAVSLLRVFP